MSRRGLGDDRGSVVAEFAVALPAVVLVLVLGAGALSAGARHVRLQDAAADAARLVARGEIARPCGARPSPAACRMRPSRSLARAISSASPRPRPAIGAVPVTLSATSCALDGGL